MDLDKIKMLLRTVVHLKLIQVLYQLYYRFRKKNWAVRKTPNTVYCVKLKEGIPSRKSYVQNTFSFLNITQTFKSIDWNFSLNGKLWTYNLNYFDFLHQEGMQKEEGTLLIHDFCSKSDTHKDAYEPYPISLRVINWVKFLSNHKIDEKEINIQLYSDLYRLKNQIEYHILANHLFENGFGLLFGAYYFQDDKLYRTAEKIIRTQLKEQISPDGAHYELTPMYHHIILYRLLDSYNLVTENKWKNQGLQQEIKLAAEKMLGWMDQITWEYGEMPMLNDSAPNIVPDAERLKKYAKNLGLVPFQSAMKESGYRKWKKAGFECILDVGPISPSYQPGHAHADSLQFLLCLNNQPILVDTGISTYEKNDRRQLERSTSSHNTVTVNHQNSSEVWSGFRVGRRAKVTIEEESDDFIQASHNGFRNLGAKHKRSVKLVKNQLIISDEITSNKNYSCCGHLHFHPDLQPVIEDNIVRVNNNVIFQLDNCTSIHLEDYQMANGYNQLLGAKKIVYTFKSTAQLTISTMSV
jgi:hypothetical protein